MKSEPSADKVSAKEPQESQRSKARGYGALQRAPRLPLGLIWDDERYAAPAAEDAQEDEAVRLGPNRT